MLRIPLAPTAVVRVGLDRAALAVALVLRRSKGLLVFLLGLLGMELARWV